LAWGWFSIAAGGVTGTGLGLGQSGNIPFITSDMIFAAIAEELGFVGVILVLCLYGSFVGEGLRIAQRATSDFVRLTATGLTALMGFQAFFIMAGVLRLLPFTGITLPFMAYGGNSLIANYLIVAILIRISDENQTERHGGEIVAVHLTQVK
jgi:cell division protein FtsW (lipid II flippase)